jgi:hypothetical protein
LVHNHQAESVLGAIADEQMAKGKLLPSRLLLTLITARFGHRCRAGVCVFARICTTRIAYQRHCGVRQMCTDDRVYWRRRAACAQHHLTAAAGCAHVSLAPLRPAALAAATALVAASAAAAACAALGAASSSAAAATVRDCARNGWILDGFPRTPEQARLLGEVGIEPDCIVVLDRPDELVREFALGRMSDSATG